MGTHHIVENVVGANYYLSVIWPFTPGYTYDARLGTSGSYLYFQT